MSSTPANTPASSLPSKTATPSHHVRSDVPFYLMLATVGGVYVVLLVGMLLADVAYLTTSDAAHGIALPRLLEWSRPVIQRLAPIVVALGKPEIRYSIKLTLASCCITALLSLIVAVPLGYTISRYRFPFRNLLDAALDIPIFLPPLVIGLSLLILFQYFPFSVASSKVVYQIPGVILAQFMVAAAFSIRTMRATFDQISVRQEQIAFTLGCNQRQAFMWVVLPRARQGMLTAALLAWARALGEFGPLLIFAGATRNKTEVLSTTVFLELSIGDLEAAVAVSLIMVVAAVVVLLIVRLWGTRVLTV
jgi:molybdate transport system permease protein